MVSLNHGGFLYISQTSKSQVYFLISQNRFCDIKNRFGYIKFDFVISQSGGGGVIVHTGLFQDFISIGIKHDFQFINIREVPREEPEVFNTSRRTLRMLMNDKIMFDRYYCINSKKTYRKLRKCLRTLFFSLTIIFLRAHAFYKYPRFGPWPGTFSHDDLKA